MQVEAGEIAGPTKGSTFHFRLAQLREQARINGVRGRNLSITMAILMLLNIAFLLYIMYTPIKIGASMSTLPAYAFEYLVMMFISMLPALLLAGYSVFVLIKAGSSFKVKYDQARDVLNRTSIGILIAEGDCIQQLEEELNRNWFQRIFMRTKPILKLEHRLEFSAYHFDNLLALTDHEKKLSRFQLSKGQQGYKNTWLWNKPTWAYILVIFFGQMFSYLGFILMVLMLFTGLRQTGSQGVLTAICDHLLLDR